LQTSLDFTPNLNLDHIAESAMERPSGAKGDHQSTHPARHALSFRFLESFFWYINIPLAHICWVVTMIDQNRGLTGVRLEEFWRTFKIPSLGLSIAYYMLSMFVFPLLSTWLVDVLHRETLA